MSRLSSIVRSIAQAIRGLNHRLGCLLTTIVLFISALFVYAVVGSAYQEVYASLRGFESHEAMEQAERDAQERASLAAARSKALTFKCVGTKKNYISGSDENISLYLRNTWPESNKRQADSFHETSEKQSIVTERPGLAVRDGDAEYILIRDGFWNHAKTLSYPDLHRGDRLVTVDRTASMQTWEDRYEYQSLGILDRVSGDFKFVLPEISEICSKKVLLPRDECPLVFAVLHCEKITPSEFDKKLDEEKRLMEITKHRSEELEKQAVDGVKAARKF